MTAARVHPRHTERVPRNTSSVPSGAISRQKGHMTITASQSSEQVHFLASLTMHPQQRGCEQQRACVRLCGHVSSPQNPCAQMKHESSSASVSCPTCLDRLRGMDTSITAAL